MTLGLGQTAPDFQQDSTQGLISFMSGWEAHGEPYLATPKTLPQFAELAEVARLRPERDKRGVKPIGLWVDDVAAHESWERDLAETRGHALNFPIIADVDKRSRNSTA